MSYKLVDAVLSMRLPDAERAVLIALCRHADDDKPLVWASVDTLSLAACMSERSTQRALVALQARNYIKAEGEKSGGRGNTVIYRLLIPNAEIVEAIQSTYKGRHSGTLYK